MDGIKPDGMRSNICPTPIPHRVFGSTTSTQNFIMQINFPVYTNPSADLNMQRRRPSQILTFNAVAAFFHSGVNLWQ